MGLEALSRGFEEVVVFEKNPKVANIMKKNYSTLGLQPNLKIGDSLKLLEKLDRKFDVIYIDPPYYSGVYEEVFKVKMSENNSYYN
jgi:16S rRNA (guanine966-N2)-methyltransferase